MWNRIIGTSDDTKDNAASQSSRRKDDEQRSTRKRSGSIASSNTARKPSRSHDRERGFHPASTSYSSTRRSAYPDTASASIASSYATASNNHTGEPSLAPGLIRNASLTNEMQKSKAKRDDRDSVGDRERKRDRRRERSPSRVKNYENTNIQVSQDRDDRKRERRVKKGKGEVNEYGASPEKARGDFNNQIVEPGFVQFPGQNDVGFIEGPPSASAPLSAHVPDQFPGQFPEYRRAI